MRLRAEGPVDAPALGRILGDWVRETGVDAGDAHKEDAGFLRHLIATAEVTVAEDGGPLGFLALEGEKVRALYLAPEARGRGVGRALLEGAKSGRGRLWLWAFEANGRAVAFHGREGFRMAERTDGAGNEARLPDLRMVWEAGR